MKIVVISDIHSNFEALEAVLERLPSYDELWCLGDIVGYGPEPNEVVGRLRALGPRVVLMGNHDYAVATGDTEGFSPNAERAVDWTRRVIQTSEREYLATLKPSAKFEIGETTFGLYHGSPTHPLTEYVYPSMGEAGARDFVRREGVRVVLLGHTHVPMRYQFSDGLLANPGSVGQPRDGNARASFGILTINGQNLNWEIARVDYDIESVAKKIRDSGLPGFLAERLYIGS